MKHFLFNLTKNTAKEAQITGGGASQVGNNSDLSPRLVRFDSLSILSRQSDLDQVRAISAGFSARVWKYAAMLLCVLMLGVGEMWGDTAYGFENNATSESGYPTSAGDGSRTISSSIKRTGSYSLEQNNNNTSDKVAKVQSLPATFKGGKHYVHSIAYIRKNTSSTVTLKGYSFYAGSEFGSQSVSTALSSDWTRVANKGQRTGNTQDYTSVEIRYKTNTATKGDKVYIDDIVVYVTENDDKTDLKKPGSATEAEASTSEISWTNGEDESDSSNGATGVQNTLIWRRTSGSANDLTLNDQGIYSLTAKNGPSTDQSGNWTLVTASVAAGTAGETSSYSGAFSAGDVYAIVHRDLAYNYSTPTYVTVAGGGDPEPECEDVDAPTSLSCTAQTQTSLTYTWSKASHASTYTAKLYSDSGCESEVKSSDLGDVATVTFSDLTVGTTYYCKVQSHGDGSTYCAAGGTTSAASGTTSACTAISPTWSYPFSTVAVGITIYPTIGGNTGGGDVTYSSSATSYITNACYATAAGSATLTANVAANGVYCSGSVTSGTITVVSDQSGLIKQTLTTGNNEWGTPSAPATTDETNITSTTVLSATNLTISGNGNTSNDGQTAKITGMTTGSEGDNSSKYMQMGFTVKSGKQLNVSAIYIPVQPVSSDDNNIKAVLTDGETTITGTLTNSKNGKLAYIKFDSYGTVKGNVTLTLYAWGWTGGYRLGKSIVIDGEIEDAPSSCTAPNHVDISGRWDRFGGETISLTATAYSSAGTESPIADANITGWQWQKLIGTTWTDVSNGTVGSVVTSGATTKNLQITNCGQGNSGKYRCVVSTGATCSTASATATDGSEGYGVKVYVLECYTDGTTVYNFTRDGENQAGSVTINLSASTAYTFKVHADDYYGNNGTINFDETNWVCSTSQGNLTVNSGLGGTFTFDVEYSTGGNSSVEGEPELSVTYPRKTVYLKPNSDWKSDGAKFAFYYFHKNGEDTDKDGWTTGFLSASVCDGDVYPASIPQWNGVKIIGVRFNSSEESPGWNGEGHVWNKTDDLVLTSNDLVEITGWSNSQTYNSNYAAPTYTISFDGNGNTSGSMTDVEDIECDASVTLEANAFVKTGYTFTGWKDGSSNDYADETTISNIRADIELTAQWTADATLTAISADVLYQAADMANITFTGSDQYWAGLSTNYLFQTYGNGTSTSAKGKTISSTDVTDDISTKSFTSHAYIEGSDVTSGTDDPTYGAIEFITPSTAGLLYVYTVDGSSSNLKLRKKGSSTFTALTGSSNYNAIAVDANSNYYIHGNASKRGIYGIKYVSTYAVSITTTDVTKATGEATAIKGKAYTATFTANTGYALPDDATVSIGGTPQTKGTGYTWAISDGTATLTVPAAKVAGAISIAVSGVELETYAVTYNGNGSTSGDAPTDENAYVEGDDVTVLGKNTLVKTNNGFAGWNTVSNGSGTWRVQGETFSMGAADVALHAQWVPTANLTVGTLYTAGDMKAKAIGSSTGYRPGYSSNGIFELLGVGTDDDGDLKNTPMQYTTDGQTIDGTAFTHALHFKGQGAGSPSGTTLPTARAIKFHVGESGTLHLWVRAGSKINIVKDGGSAAAVGSSTDRTHEKVEVTAGTWYLYATGTSVSLYGMKLMTCTDPELAYGTTAVAKNYGDDAFTNPLTKAEGASPAFSSDNPSVATVDDSTGEVTIVGVGSATITASIADDATYCDDEASYTLTVYPSYTVTYNAMGGTCGTESAVTELGEVTLPSATHGTYTTYTWVTYDGAFVGYEGEEYEPSGNITLYAKWQGDCAAGGGSDGVLFSAEFKDSGLGTSNICTAANDPVTFTTDQLKAEPIGGSISAYTTKDLTHMQYVANGICIHGTDGVIKITLEAAINTNDLFEYVNVHSSNPYAYLRHTSASNTTDQIVLTGYNSKNVKVMLPAAFNGKKELYIVKQSTDFKLHKAAVVRPAFLMLLRDDTPTATTNLSGTDEALTTENYLEVIRGGSASYTSPSSGNLQIIQNSSKNYIKFNSTAGYVKIVLNDALQEGDVIGFDASNTDNLALTVTAEHSTSITTTNQLYTVGSSSPLKDKTTFYLWQNSGSGNNLRGLQIARSAVVGSSCYAVIYEGNGADGGYTNDPKAYDDEDNDVVVLLNGYTRTGYEFVGWNTAADGSGTPYAPLETISDIDDDVTLYAQWRILITSDNTNFSGYTSVGATDDVRVAGGATLTLTESKTIHDITIETGSTLNVAKDGEDGITVATNSLYLRGGWNSSYTSYDMPRVYIDPASTLTKEVATVNYDISVDANNYYPIAVPFRVKVSDVDYANSTLAGASTYETHYVIKEYDGARRAEVGPDRVNNWKVVRLKDDEENDVYLEPGRGYIMTAVSIPAYGGGVIRFPLSFTNAWTAEGEQGTIDDSYYKNVVAVKAYEGAATADDKKVNKGWNLLGVPFMSCYATDEVGNKDAIIQGRYDFKNNTWIDGTIRYVNVPSHDFAEYIQSDVTDPETILRPGWCFMVQIEENGNLTFVTAGEAENSDLPIYAPKRENENMPTVTTGIILSGAEASDKTTFLVSDKYSAADYEINADLEKLFGSGYTLATYSLSGSTRLAYNAMSKNDATAVIPIGYRAPAEGSYTFSINPRYAENGAFQRVDLIDYEAGQVTNLLMTSYTFESARTQNDSRFAINVVMKPTITTDVETISDEGLEVSGAHKMIIDDKLYIILDGKMYDATGKVVKGGKK